MRLIRNLLGLFLLVSVTPCFASITHVQQASTNDMTGNTYSSVSATFASPTTSGHAIIVAITFGYNPNFTVTDSQGNTYTQAIRTSDAGHGQGNAIYYATNIQGGSSNTVTVNFSVPTSWVVLTIHEYAGVAASSALDVTAGQVGSSQTNLSSGSATTTANGDLIFVSVVDDSTGSGDTYTAGTGFTKRVDLGIDAGFADEDQIQTSAGSIAGTWTISPSEDTITDMVAFRASTTGGGASPSITNLSPLSGGAGVTVTLIGTNFGSSQGSSTVTLNGTTATVSSSGACPSGWSNTCIAATVPSGATSGPVVVTVNGVPSNGVNFTVSTAVINLVQQASNGDMSGNDYTAFSATLPVATTSGNTIIVAVSFGDDNTVTVTDSQNNTYIQAIRTDDFRDGCYNALAIFYATNIVGGAQNTVTVNFGLATAWLGLGVHEYSGIVTASPLDGSSGNLGNGISVSSGSATTSGNGDLIFSAAWEDSVGFGDAFTPGNAFTKRLDLEDEDSYVDADQVQGIAGPIAGTWTMSPSGLNWIASIAAFKAQTGESGPPSITSLSPSSNSIGGLVTVNGTNFGATQGSSVVTFNGTAAAIATSGTCSAGWSNTCIAVTVPNGATTGPVVVSVGGVASNAVNFTLIVNQPPVVTVGPDQTINYPTNTASLTGNVTDDGYPIGDTLQISWSKVVGPGTVSFNPSQCSAQGPCNTQATFSVPGNYVLRLSADDGQYTSSADTRVIYSASLAGGIAVSAGPDQVLVFPASASLSGLASDSNPSLAPQLTTTWTVVSGPPSGTVTFGNSASLATTASFSVSGVYDLRLTASDGVFAASSDVKIYSGNVQCTLSNKGTDFWLMFTGVGYLNTPTTPPRQLEFFISSDVATTGTVFVPGQSINLPFTTTPGQITTVVVPQSAQMISSDTIESKGIHITAQNSVAVYGLNFVPFQTDGYLALPTPTLGTSYVVASYKNTIGSNGGDTFGTEFGITATQDNTTVTIVPTATAGSRNAYVPFTIPLNQGQTYQLRNKTNHTELSTSQFSNGPAVDFTGTVVSSDKPIAVFGGHDCADVPDGSLYCNGLVEQMPPTNLWGQNFVTMPLSSELNGDVFRFVSQADNTHVQVNHQQVATLGKGQFFEQLITEPAEITADNPILTVQYAQSGLAGGNENTDPSMIVVPPFEQFGGSYTVETPTNSFPANYLNVIAPTAAVQGAGVMLDGSAIPASAFQPIGTSPFSGAQIQASVGAHTLNSGLPFGLWVYGFNEADAYGYTGGVCLARGVSDSTLTASPKAATNQLTSQACIQATIVDVNGQPIGGSGVTFTVAGINPQTGFATTNSAGVATFCYTSTKTGSDLITVTAGGASDTASVTWVSNVNQPPVVNAGPNLTANLQSGSQSVTVTLNGSVTDDGLPVGGTLTSSWTELSGPASVSFGTPSRPQTTSTFTQAGTYVLQLAANDSQLSSSANVTVTVFPPNQPPSLTNVGPNQAIIWVLNRNQSVALSGTVNDDGLPVGSTLTANWNELSGPGVAVLGSASFSGNSAINASTSVSLPAPGPYTFQLSASDTQFTTTSNVSVYAYGPVNVNLGPSLSTFVNSQTLLSPTVLVGGIPPTPTMPLKLVWNVTSQPSGSHVTFGTPNAVATTASFDTPGSYQVELTTSDANVPTSSVGNCCLAVIVAPANAQPPTVSITSPVDGTQLTAPTAVTGNVSGGTWTLAYALQDDFHPMTFTTIATGTGAVSNGTLGTLDPTLLLNGTYVLQLTSVDGTSGLFESASVMVSVARNMKVGVFSLSFNDLAIPVSGIPIQVIRSYDSRDKGQGDFGIGWHLSLTNVRLQKAHDFSINWQETQTQNSFLPQFCLAPTDNKIATVTFPDGRVFTFQAGSNPQCQLAVPITNATLTFTELPGPASTAGATLTPADGGQFLVDGDAPGPVTTVGLDGNPYNPTIYILQTADGTKYTINQQLGLTSVTDPNGNTLTISPNGVSSSAGGKSVPFLRDDQGRITRITDPNGNTLLYAYNSNGDLVGFTDRVGNATVYAYDTHHDLTSITTPDGNQALANAYDSSGRLTGSTDEKGFSVSFSNNVAAQTQTITDRNGNPTTYAYDSDGNVTQVTDALSHNTTSTYDANDNKLSETNALGTSIYTYDANGNQLTQTDPLNHTTTYTYNGLNKPLTVTDANSHTTTNTYDANGNLLTRTDALGKQTINTYTNAGLLASTKDPLGNTTSFTYSGSGNPLTQTDPLGTVTTYTYDGNNNRTSQSVTRTLPGGSQQTLLTTYVYDGNGRQTQTTYPDLSTTQTTYNSLGQQATTVDALSHTTSYQYDADGNLTQTTYPDGSTDNSNYDHNGNRTRLIDHTGVTTSYIYDALNRGTQTQDSSARTLSSTSYDAIGDVLSTTDANGNATQYAYDAAGRRITVTDALTHVTTFGYDAVGNQTSVKDANNNTTTYSYDSDNRRTRVTYPDGKFETTAYDALGRVTSRTDANGKVTQYNYDGLGRLVSVVQDAVSGGLNLLTQYSYDQVGDRMSQTDANSHTTNYAYDQRGRRTQRTLPLGQSESYSYDAAGNLLTHTDFNGKTTTFTYDAANRLLSKTPDPSFQAPAVSYTYVTAGPGTGRRHTMTDASGTTTYEQYDSRARLTLLVKPAGQVQYTYDLAGNLKQLLGPLNVNYSYDALNRLSTVSETNTGTTTYAYDNVGNLASVTGPNGVVHTYTYDTRNRLTNLGVSNSVTTVASYAYTLDAAGHRLSVSELSGRTVNYGYDSIYRLTSETIANDPNSVNGAVNYSYDSVGNRKQITSTLAPIPAGLFNYNANDQFTAGDTYDADGNTVSSGGIANTYDFENHLIQKGGVSIVYDGDGNRVAKTAAGVTTTYLVDTLNPTGYAQVLGESFSPASSNGEVSHNYVYGLELISQTRKYNISFNGTTQQIFYAYDGHGSVRALTNTSGAVTDTYDYDAFGNLIHSTGSTLNNYLFAGEQFDPDLGLYYNRARYLNASTGRFWTIDKFEGDDEAPLSLHKYLYVSDDPANNTDHSGNQIDDLAAEEAVSITADTAPTINLIQTLNGVRSALTVAAGLGAKVLSDPTELEEIEGAGQAGIQVVQRSFVQMENILTEAEAEATSIAENGSQARQVLNQLYTNATSPNPGNIEYHHIVEQGGQNASTFGRALQSFGNIVPLPEQIHVQISRFYQTAWPWVPDGTSLRAWMYTQDWETQWSIGLQIVKEVILTGQITWHL